MNKKSAIILTSLFLLASVSYYIYIRQRNKNYEKIEDESFVIYVEKNK